MSAKVIEFPRFDHWSEAYWGVCPECGRHDGLVNVGSGENWFVCHRHRVKWCVGENLFSGWKNEIEQDPEGYRRRGGRIAGYRELSCSQVHDAAIARGLLCPNCLNSGVDQDGNPCPLASEHLSQTRTQS